MTGSRTSRAHGAGGSGARAGAARAVLPLTLALTAVALLLAAWALPAPERTLSEQLPVAVVLLLAFLLAECLVLHVEIDDSAHSASLAELPLVLGLLWVDPLVLVAARLLGGGVALLAVRRMSGEKAAFNLASFALEVVVAAAVLGALPLSPDSGIAAWWLGLVLTCTVSAAVSGTAVLTAIRLSGGHPDRQDAYGLLATGALIASMTATLALLAASVLAHDVAAALPLAALAAGSALAYRAHARLRTQRDRLHSLYGFVRRLSTTADDDEAVRHVLVQTRELLKADVAVVVLPDDERDRRPGAGVVEHVLSADGSLTSRRHPADTGPASGGPLLAPRGTREPAAVQLLQRWGLGDAVVVPLPGEHGGTAGALLVGNRRSEHATFEPADLLALEGLAGHAAVALRNARLVDRLTHESRHDALTGLPNRTEFERRLDTLLATGSPAAVLFMDLDRFKDVNDTLGHHAGDRLLREVAGRLRDSLPRDCTVARLGGDEFAVVLPHADAEQGTRTADLLRASLQQPVDVEGVQVEVGASVGVALAPLHGEDAGLLMRRADIAMYAAKAGSSTALYEPERDATSASRLALAAQLREGLRRGELLLHFQPQVDARTARVQRCEALVRWHSPRRGLVPPDEFIPVAERAGLLPEITAWVTGAALDALVGWREAGHDLGVAVNLSPRDLLDPTLPARVAHALAVRGLPPSALTLEITEGTIMSEPERVRATLAQLRATGVRLSVDDFGTGYSSLAYLKQLPVDEVKVDRSFVRHLAQDEQDLAIVRAVVALAGTLRLEVVAEGVEDEASWDRLDALGCSTVQGYHVSRPLPQDRVLPWLAAQRPRRSPALHALPAPRGELQQEALQRA